MLFGMDKGSVLLTLLSSLMLMRERCRLLEVELVAYFPSVFYINFVQPCEISSNFKNVRKKIA